jgi:hypothetical protein
VRQLRARADDALMRLRGLTPGVPACPIFGRGGGVLFAVLLRTLAATAATRRDCGEGPELFCLTAWTRGPFSRAGAPMTDVAYQCHNCGSVHEAESIRENLILDLRAAASYGLSGQRGMLDPRPRFLRWRMTRGLAQALWPGYSHHPRLSWAGRLVQRPPAPVPDRRVPCRATTDGSDGRASSPALAGTNGRGAGISVDVSAPLRQDHDQPVWGCLPAGSGPDTVQGGQAPASTGPRRAGPRGRGGADRGRGQ